jgi:hypothetical protein
MNYYERLDKIRQDYPELTFDNNGYEYLSADVKERHENQIEEITDILSEAVPGFIKFNNFKPRKDGSFDVRMQVDWCYGTDSKLGFFDGVDYVCLESFKGLEQ